MLTHFSPIIHLTQGMINQPPLHPEYAFEVSVFSPAGALVVIAVEEVSTRDERGSFFFMGQELLGHG